VVTRAQDYYQYMRLSRRCCLRSLAGLASLGIARRAEASQARPANPIADFMVTMPTCSDLTKLTPAVPSDGTFRPQAAVRTRLAPANVTTGLISLAGIVSGLKCGPIAGARVDFWQADAGGGLDQRERGLRGSQTTDARGRYGLTTIRPGARPGRAPHISARVVAPSGQTVWTELFFAGDPANAGDPRCREELALLLSPSPGGQQARFDFVLDA